MEVRKTMTVEEWAREAGISRGSAYEAVRLGQAPGVIRIGRRVVISREAWGAVLAGVTL